MAAGLGFKTFTTGEVLTAADVNGYLMQGILVFANAAARSSAITSPQEGQYSFLKDTNALEYYDGAAWVGAPVGDITAVNAGTGITGGGASGTVTITNDMATTITASGDIVVGTGNGTYDNLPIGTTGQVLTADTTVSPYKVKWASGSTAFDTYTNFTPSFTGFTLGNGTINYSQYSQSGKLVHFWGKITLGSTSSMTGNPLEFSLPVAAIVRDIGYHGVGYIEDASASNAYQAVVYIGSGGSGAVSYGWKGSAANVDRVTNTLPMTWATNDIFTWSVLYRAA